MIRKEEIAVKRISDVASNHFYLIIFLAFFALSTYFAWELDLWVDEAHTLITTNGPADDVLNKSIYYERQSPLYFIVLYAWRQINQSVFFGRCLSILFVMLALELYRREMSSLLTNKKMMVFALSLFVFSPYIIEYATQMRRYAMVLFFSGLIASTFVRAYLKENRHRLYRMGFILTGVLGVYSDYYFGMLLACVSIFAIVVLKKKKLKFFFLDCILILILIIPAAMILKIQLGLMSNEFQAEGVGALKKCDMVLTAFEDMIFPVISSIENRLLRWMLRGIFVLYIVSTFIRRKRFQNSDDLKFRLHLFVSVVGSIIFFAVIASLAPAYLVHSRYLILIYFSIILLVTVVASEDKSKVAAVTFFLMVIGSNLYVVSQEFGSLSRINEFRNIATYLNANEKDNEPIYLFPSEFEYGFMQYYKGKNMVQSIPRSWEKDAFDPAGQIISSKEELRLLFQSLASKQNIWIIMWPVKKSYAIDYNYTILEEYLKRYTIKGERELKHGIKIIKYEVR